MLVPIYVMRDSVTYMIVLQMTMPGDKTFGSGDSWFGQELVDAVNNGVVEESRVDVCISKHFSSILC
jgi:hypothetical protein